MGRWRWWRWLNRSNKRYNTGKPGVVTTTNAHGPSDGQAVTLTDVVGMTEVNGNEYYADVLTPLLLLYIPMML